MKLSFLFFLLASRLASFSQFSFSGQWKLNPDKVSWGQAPRFVLPVSFDVMQKKMELTISRTVLDDQSLEHVYMEHWKKSGDKSETDTYLGYKRSAILQWKESAAGFTLETQSIAPDGNPGSSTVETWSLMDGGKTLVMQREVKQADGGQYTIVGYYERG